MTNDDLVRNVEFQREFHATALFLHRIIILLLKIIVVFIIVVAILWQFLRCLGEIDRLSPRATAIVDNVVGIDFLHVVVVCFLLDCNN